MLQNLQSNPKSTIIKKSCPFCKKVAHTVHEEIQAEKYRVLTLECGHTIAEEISAVDKAFTCKSISGKEPFPFQYKTLDFIVQSGYRAGVFHEQGVGKTICALITIKQNPAELMPFLVVCKRSLQIQWFKEIVDWLGIPSQLIENKYDKPFPELFKAFIVSYDLLSDRGKKENELLPLLQKVGFKLIIIDECQQIKNPEAKRTKAIRNLVKMNGEDKSSNILALSGTPIKNNAGEYFTILNILRSDIFPSQAQYLRDYCDTYQSGWSYKIGGISRYAMERFKEKTDSWVIRYERNDVLPDLPKIFRKAFFVELGKEVEDAYKKAYLEFKEEYLSGDGSFKDSSSIIAKMARLRHLTGLSKLNSVTEFVEEFLEETDKKIVLFVHHKDVGTGLINRLTEVCSRLKLQPPLQITSENQEGGIRADEKFKTDPNARVLIASTLAAGEGKNWQMCSDAIIVEHQWNPANEEQAEGRFPRPGSTAQSISITYAIATGTIDEFLAELKAKKREYCRTAFGHESVGWNQDSLMKELADVLFTKGGEKWSI